MREDVGDDPILTRVVGQARGFPVLPGGGEEGEQRCVVHRFDRRVVVGDSGDDLGAGADERRADRLGPRRPSPSPAS